MIGLTSLSHFEHSFPSKSMQENDNSFHLCYKDIEKKICFVFIFFWAVSPTLMCFQFERSVFFIQFPFLPLSAKPNSEQQIVSCIEATIYSFSSSLDPRYLLFFFHSPTSFLEYPFHSFKLFMLRLYFIYSGVIECKEPIEVVSYKIGVCKVSAKGKDCLTVFQKLGFNGKTSVVLCKPRTGRMHQIRVHLQFLGKYCRSIYLKRTKTLNFKAFVKYWIEWQ